MVRAAKAGQTILSNGPFMEVTVHDPAAEQTLLPGGQAVVKEGKLQIAVRVQCPNWLDVNEVRVLVNGRPDPQLSFTREKHPDRFGSGVVKFDQTLPLELERDAHIIVVAGGRGLTLGRVMGSFWATQPPTAVSNPIFIDVDGDGFKPNGDTLDFPLPVRYGYPKPAN